MLPLRSYSKINFLSVGDKHIVLWFFHVDSAVFKGSPQFSSCGTKLLIGGERHYPFLYWPAGMGTTASSPPSLSNSAPLTRQPCLGEHIDYQESVLHRMLCKVSSSQGDPGASVSRNEHCCDLSVLCSSLRREFTLRPTKDHINCPTTNSVSLACGISRAFMF